MKHIDVLWSKENRQQWKEHGHFEKFVLVLICFIWLEFLLVGIDTLIMAYTGETPTLFGAVCAIIFVIYPISYELAGFLEDKSIGSEKTKP